MDIAEVIFAEAQTLPEEVAQQVLDFIRFLKIIRSERTIPTPAAEANLSEFDQFGAVFDGQFNRDECYDREILR
ncbi:MAG: hypothetical protein EA342_01100 [Leptolyngbya sp. LCM1.Bin17]|nr:MAG: hypothetical protein EA342_01100 [Leptolyngbya sp. LCM1.Bin17]